MIRWLVLVLGGWSAAACGAEAVPETPVETAPASTVIVADTVTVDVPIELPTQLYVERDAWVYARAMGIVQRVLVDLGDRVREGQVLARLEDVDQRIALDDAEANLANAERLVHRFRELGGAGAVTVADSEAAELEYQRWQLRVRQARRDLELTRAVAPFAGVITARTVRQGQLVEELDSLFRVTALRPLRASVQLPEQAGPVERGSEVTVLAADGTAYPARVERVSPTIDPASGTREVIVELTGEPRLEPGRSVQVRLASAPRQLVVLPREAVAPEGYVVVWEDGRTAIRQVTTGAALPDGRVPIVRGLAPGERVAPIAR